MTAVRLEPAAGTTVDAGPAAEVVGALADRLPGIGLAELEGSLALLARVDRKYFVPAERFARFAETVAGDLRALDIDGGRLFGYETTYLDSPDLVTYRAHLQGRRRRFKVRVRTYVDAGVTLLEVKLKGPRGETVKHRRPHPGPVGRTLDRDAHGFVAGCVAASYDLPVPWVLTPVLTTANRRATFASTTEDARLTCDVGLTCRAEDRLLRMRDDHVLVETKSGPGAGRLDLALRSLGVRPVSVSKYCVGVATLRPEMAGNPWHRVLRSYFHPFTPHL